MPSELVRGDMARLHLPPDLPLLHLELSIFYYPGHHDFPLPPPCLLLTANPITVWLDILTLVWLNAFTVNLQKSVAELQRSLQLDEGDASYANVKVTLLLSSSLVTECQVEAVMPRIIVSSRGTVHCPSPLRPDSLQVSASKYVEFIAVRISEPITAGFLWQTTALETPAAELILQQPWIGFSSLRFSLAPPSPADPLTLPLCTRS